MAVEIIPIALGFDTCYVLRGSGVVAVDAGAPNKVDDFLSGLQRASIRPEDVQLVVITHGHWDHIGSARDLKSATGAKLAMHEREIAWLEQSLTPHPPGVTLWGRILAFIAKTFVMPLIKVPPAEVDVPLGDEGLSLSDYGIPGRVLYTPGHSSGSVSILLDSGEAFVGDLAMNTFPLRLSPGLPVLAEDPAAVIASWELLLEAGATEVYPAHGKPFPAEVMRRAIAV
jgi:glyoxylase-like metal-dependent hydrolase (beta-lactamase superfamily II)